MQQELKTESQQVSRSYWMYFLLALLLSNPSRTPPPAATVRDLLPPSRGRLSVYGSRSINTADLVRLDRGGSSGGSPPSAIIQPAELPACNSNRRCGRSWTLRCSCTRPERPPLSLWRDVTLKKNPLIPQERCDGTVLKPWLFHTVVNLETGNRPMPNHTYIGICVYAVWYFLKNL